MTSWLQGNSFTAVPGLRFNKFLKKKDSKYINQT
jgi:hypothetical protein